MLRSKLMAAAVVAVAALVGYASIPDVPGSAVGDEQALRVSGGQVGVGTVTAPHNQSITGGRTVCSCNYYPDCAPCGLATEKILGGPGYYCYTDGACSSKFVTVWLYCGYARAVVCG